jgi:hypothetical protein
MGTHDVITSSENPNWRTPKWLARALNREFYLALDAAADATCSVVPGNGWLGPGSTWLEDGVCGVSWWDVVETSHGKHSDNERRAIFVNPPYSIKRYRASVKAGQPDPAMLIETWVKQASLDGSRGTVVGVIPYSPQTEWWRGYVESQDPKRRAVEIRRFPFRIAFDAPDDYAPQGTYEDGTRGKASGANVNTVIAIWSPRGAEYVEPWQTPCRYWVPRQYYARNGRLP